MSKLETKNHKQIAKYEAHEKALKDMASIKECKTIAASHSLQQHNFYQFLKVKCPPHKDKYAKCPRAVSDTKKETPKNLNSFQHNILQRI